MGHQAKIKQSRREFRANPKRGLPKIGGMSRRNKARILGLPPRLTERLIPVCRADRRRAGEFRPVKQIIKDFETAQKRGES